MLDYLRALVRAQWARPAVRRLVLPALALLLAAASIVVTTSSPSPQTVTVTVHARAPLNTVPSTIAVDGPDRDAKPDDPVAIGASARVVAADFATHRFDLAGPLRGPDHGPVAKLQPPFAADSVPGCRTRFLTTNWSARTVPPSQVKLFWLHYTGGPDLPNSRGDVDGLTAFGDSPAARVSWHFNMDKDGNCDYNVPLRYKAWTEAGANSTGISIEVAGTGSGGYLRPGGVRELHRIIAYVHEAYPAIDFRLGGVSNCSPTRGGIVTHWMGGPCSGGHVDIKPYALPAVIAELAAAGHNSPTAQKACDTLNWHRRRAHIIGRWSPARRLRARALLSSVHAAGGRCPRPARYARPR